MPTASSADAGTRSAPTGGRGVALVADLADHWVPYPTGGKTVRAELLDITTSA